MPLRTSAHGPSLWADPIEAEVAEVISHYNHGKRRDDLLAVEGLRRALSLRGVPHSVVVVGTNGKTSTATYVSRLLTAAGIRTGLYTSPHVGCWTERVLIDGRPCDGDELLSALRRCDAVAQARTDRHCHSLRFFDVLTLAAEQIFGDHAVDVGVFEAGIGGRLDATQVLRPGVVALSSIGYDHQSLLGETLEEILVEKLAVASGPADLVTPRLPGRLGQIERDWAAQHDISLTKVDAATVQRLAVPAGTPPAQRQNLAVALATTARAVERFRLPVEPGDLLAYVVDIDVHIRGRFESGTVAGVRYLADTAHNLTAWEELGGVLRRTGAKFVAVVAATVERRPDQLADTLKRSGTIAEAIATSTSVRAGHSAVALRSVLEDNGLVTSIAELPEQAFSAAVERAANSESAVLVTGSSYVVSDFLAWLEMRLTGGDRARPAQDLSGRTRSGGSTQTLRVAV